MLGWARELEGSCCTYGMPRMQYASMIAKGVTGDPTVLSAREVLEMATLRGARALGLEAETGSIKAGGWHRGIPSAECNE